MLSHKYRGIKMYSGVCLMLACCKSYPVLHQRIKFVREVFIGTWEGPNLQEACDNTTTVIQLENRGHGV